MRGPGEHETVAAVVLTRNRSDSVAVTLRALERQTRRVDEIIVVDNASTDDTVRGLREGFPEVTVIRNDRNLGAAGGRSIGMAEAFERGHDLVWFVDDDSVPADRSLARTLEVAARIPGLGMLGQSGGTIVGGVIRHRRWGERIAGAPDAQQVDFVLTDGAIVTRDAFDRVGGLDGRYFIMMEDIEYPLRVKDAGFVVARADLGLSFGHLGALPEKGGASAPWRIYYQTRNHLRMAIERRSLALVFGWLYRQLGALVHLPAQPDRQVERLRMRWAGTVDALRNRMGEVVPPGEGPGVTDGDVSTPISAFPPYRGKRVLDLVVLALVAVPAALLGAVCALAVRATSSGPVLFTQERIGRNGEPFTVYKFRTMVAGDNPIFPDATRITSAGRWLRRLSLDELPQLINVARGEMSIVGPRPTLAYQVERYDDRQWQRLSVRPGLTGLAQINGRNELSWSERIEYDLAYVRNQSVRDDLRILLRTASTVITGRGAEGHAVDDPLAVVDGVSAAGSVVPDLEA